MVIHVKICGVTSEDALEAAIDAGAEFVGFVFFPRSPRHLELATAASLAQRARARITTVALTVNAPLSQLETIVTAVRPDYLQLHGEETIARVREIRDFTKLPILKAVKVGTREDVLASRVFEAVADILLFDAHVQPSPNALPGGNGESFDWTFLRDAGLRPNYMLSGGLNPDNVRDALAISGAVAVDVSSGIEDAPGRKNVDLIARFVAAAKSQHSTTIRAAAE